MPSPPRDGRAPLPDADDGIAVRRADLFAVDGD